MLTPELKSSARFSLASFGLSITAVVVFLLLILSVQVTGKLAGAAEPIAGLTFLLIVPGAIVCAVIGVIADKRKLLAILALVSSLVCLFLTSLQMTV